MFFLRRSCIFRIQVMHKLLDVLMVKYRCFWAQCLHFFLPLRTLCFHLCFSHQSVGLFVYFLNAHRINYAFKSLWQLVESGRWETKKLHGHPRRYEQGLTRLRDEEWDARCGEGEREFGACCVDTTPTKVVVGSFPPLTGFVPLNVSNDLLV